MFSIMEKGLGYKRTKTITTQVSLKTTSNDFIATINELKVTVLYSNKKL